MESRFYKWNEAKIKRSLVKARIPRFSFVHLISTYFTHYCYRLGDCRLALPASSKDTFPFEYTRVTSYSPTTGSAAAPVGPGARGGEGGANTLLHITRLDVIKVLFLKEYTIIHRAK